MRDFFYTFFFKGIKILAQIILESEKSNGPNNMDEIAIKLICIQALNEGKNKLHKSHINRNKVTPSPYATYNAP
jgi:hypothetical protein